MSIVIKIPTWATFNKIPVGTPVEGLAALNLALGTSLQVGDPNPVWTDLQDLDLGGGPLTRGETLDSLSQVTPISNSSFITLDQIGLCVAVGGEAEGVQVLFEFTDEASLDAEVPSSWPNRTWMDLTDPDNPVEVTHTFKTWCEHGSPNNYPQKLGDKWYLPNNNWQNSGLLLPASTWIFSGLNYKTVKEYLELLNNFL